MKRENIMFLKIEYALLLQFVAIMMTKCFVPTTIVDYLTTKIDASTSLNFGKATDYSLSHEDIIRHGITRSLAKLFYDYGGVDVDMNNLDKYVDFETLYNDYFSNHLAHKLLFQPKKKEIQLIMKTEFELEDASVDLNSATRLLPEAHFDAEAFTASNQRVIDFTANIKANIVKGSYSDARKLAGQVSHTFQDFYSHSNWVELGNTDINKVIFVDSHLIHKVQSFRVYGK